jgi:hypothetical protein
MQYPPSLDDVFSLTCMGMDNSTKAGTHYNIGFFSNLVGEKG